MIINLWGVFYMCGLINKRRGISGSDPQQLQPRRLVYSTNKVNICFGWIGYFTRVRGKSVEYTFPGMSKRIVPVFGFAKYLHLILSLEYEREYKISNLARSFFILDAVFRPRTYLHKTSS